MVTLLLHLLRLLPMRCGGRQRTRFQQSRSSITIAQSNLCLNRCPARDAIVLLRSPAGTPSQTSRRQYAIGWPRRAGSSTACRSTQSGRGMIAVLPGARPSSHAYRRPDACSEGGATTYPDCSQSASQTVSSC